jgi:hypothetical protein
MQRCITVLVTAAIVSAAAVPLASASPRAVSVVSVVTSATQSGNNYRAAADLYRGKTKVGKAGYTCAQDSKGKTCTGTIRVSLSDGTLRLKYAYVSADPGRTTITIAGGTGAYAGARGTGTYTPLNASDSRQALKLRIQ